MQLLGEQFELCFLAADANKEGNSTAEAQQGTAASQIGAWAARCTIMRRATATHAIPIEVSVDDAELASRIIRISLLIKALMPEPQGQAP